MNERGKSGIRNRKTHTGLACVNFVGLCNIYRMVFWLVCCCFVVHTDLEYWILNIEYDDVWISFYFGFCKHAFVVGFRALVCILCACRSLPIAHYYRNSYFYCYLSRSDARTAQHTIHTMFCILAAMANWKLWIGKECVSMYGFLIICCFHFFIYISFFVFLLSKRIAIRMFISMCDSCGMHYCTTVYGQYKIQITNNKIFSFRFGIGIDCIFQLNLCWVCSVTAWPYIRTNSNSILALQMSCILAKSVRLPRSNKRTKKFFKKI